MTQRGGESLTTWIMFVPLLVVPVVAIFGVPQFTSPSSDAHAEQDTDLELSLRSDAPLSETIPPFPQESVRQGREERPASSGSRDWVDPFSQSLSDGSSSSGVMPASYEQPANDLGGGDPFAPRSNSQALSSTEATERFADRSATGNMAGDVLGAGYSRSNPSSRISSPSSRGTVDSRELTWRDAVRRLNKLGARQLQLAQTDEPSMFRFACDFTPDDNPRITHRFEAEAGEPLQAVENVIQQVETWLAQRTTR